MATEDHHAPLVHATDRPAVDEPPVAAAVAIPPAPVPLAVRRQTGVGRDGGELDADTSDSIERQRPRGRPLEGGVLSRMQSAFGADLSSVRVHTDGDAGQLSRLVSARAFTTGRDIFFGRGEYAPETKDGEHLLAHELAHTLQSRGSTGPGASPLAQRKMSVGMLSVVADPGAEPDPGTTIRRVFDVAVGPSPGPSKPDGSPTWMIGSIVIKNRPDNPDTTGMPEKGGKSFHHESAWTLVEQQVTQWQGRSLQEVVGYLVMYGLDQWKRLPDPGGDPMSQMHALNTYFKEFLIAKAGIAPGWLGPKGTHASQGGKISTGIRSLKTSWTKQGVTKLLTDTFEPDEDLEGEALFEAAKDHGGNFYAAFQQELEDERPGARIDEQLHATTLEWITDWESGYFHDPSDLEDAHM